MKKYFKKIIAASLIISTCVLSVLTPLSSVVTANEKNGNIISKETFLDKVKDNEFFNEYKDNFIEKQPKLVDEIKDSEQNKLGYIAQYELYLNSNKKIDIEKDLKINLETETSGLITFFYDSNKDDILVVLTDYRNLIDNEIKLINLTDCIEQNIKINENDGNLYKKAEELRTVNDNLITEAYNEIKPLYHSNCVWWVCKKYDTVGGYVDSDCTQYLGLACTTPIVSRLVYGWGSAICAGGVLISCYVPKTKHCVSGYWETKYCPSDGNF